MDLSAPREDLESAITAALDICLRDITLSVLLAELTAAERDVLLQVAVSTIPPRFRRGSMMVGIEVVPVVRRRLAITGLSGAVKGRAQRAEGQPLRVRAFW